MRCPTKKATLVVTAGTAMYALTELGGLVAGESVCVTGPGPIGLMALPWQRRWALTRSSSPGHAITG